jgi:hypothetical protein
MWEEPLSDQLPFFAVVAFLSVVNSKPCPAGLVARLCSTRPRSSHFLSDVQERIENPACAMTNALERSEAPVSFKFFILSHMQESHNGATGLHAMISVQILT